MVLVALKDGGAIFRPEGPPQKAGPARQRGTPAVGSRKVYATAADAVAELERRHGPRSAIWTYHNAARTPVGVIVRWNTVAGKDVRPVSRTLDGSGWIIGGMPTPRPLYALPHLLLTTQPVSVFVVEGEKAADAAREIGLVATTSPHGSRSASKADWSPLAGLDVVISLDNDLAGEEYASDVTRLAMAAGAQSVRIVRLVELWADMPEGGDIADYLEHRRSQGASVETIRAEVEALATQTAAETAPMPRTSEAVRFDLERVFPSATGYATNYLAALSRSTQTPIEMPALLGLTIASAAVCNVAQVRGHGDHVEPAPLWGLVLSDPAVRKSAVLSELLVPVLAWEKCKAEELAPVIAAAAQRRKIDEKHLKSIEDKAARSADAKQAATLTSEAVRMAQEMHAEPIPTAPVLLASEPTPEALSRQMVANHGRALLASAEADALDIVQGRYSGSRNYGILLKGHAGDAVRAQRVGRAGDTIDRPALAVALCVQPQAVRELWSDPHAEGRGFLARFAVVYPADRIGYRDVRPAPVPAKMRAEWQSALSRLLAFPPSDSPMIIGLDAGADALYHEFQKRTEAALGVGDLVDRRAWGGKLCGLVLRIALTLHALGTWALGGRPEAFPLIDAATMRAAIAWADYLASAERHARELLSESEDRRKARRLVELIRRMGGDVSGRELVQQSRSFKTVAEAEAALTDLVALPAGSWVTPRQSGRGGPKARRFVLSAEYRVNVYRNGTASTGNANPVDVDGANDSSGTCDDWGEA